MTEAFKPTPDEVTKVSNKDRIVSAIRSERGEIKVGDTGGIILLAGIYFMLNGTDRNLIPEIALGAGMAGTVLLEALVTTLRKK